MLRIRYELRETEREIRKKGRSREEVRGRRQRHGRLLLNLRFAFQLSLSNLKRTLLVAAAAATVRDTKARATISQLYPLLGRHLRTGFVRRNGGCYAHDSGTFG